ncbi:MAG TPA: valine--tRNA ligase, partial [Patescibacteria group bacterium]|nr:valine--tRNA ligase [Patescibacteria group bacterium]
LLYHDDALIADNEELLKHLVRSIDTLSHVDEGRGLRLAASGRDVWLDISADTLYEHQTNLERRLAGVRQSIAALEARLSNTSYIEKAPTHLVDETKQKLADETAHAERLVAELDVLGRD